MSIIEISGTASQAIFDTLMRTISEPGTIGTLPSEGLDPAVPPAAWLGLALADVGVTVATNTETSRNLSVSALVADTTGATIGDIASAWIVMLDQPSASDVALIQTGSALEPEAGARVAIAVEAVSPIAQPGFDELTLSGPGIPGRRSISINGVARSVLQLFGRASGDFPTGFDGWFFAPDGHVVAIPRSTEITFETEKD